MEIKEILDRLDYNEWEVDLYEVPITWCELYDIRDYITNLQQENERLKEALEVKSYCKYANKCNEIYDCSKEEYNDMIESQIRLVNRINDAIEYIKENAWYMNKDDEEILDRIGIEGLLKILEGDNNE